MSYTNTDSGSDSDSDFTGDSETDSEYDSEYDPPARARREDPNEEDSLEEDSLEEDSLGVETDSETYNPPVSFREKRLSSPDRECEICPG